MLRLDPPRRPSLLARAAWWYARRILGRVPTPFRLVANHNRVFRGQIAMERQLMKLRHTPASLRSLVELRAATLIGCRFCIDIGSALSQTHVVTAEQIRDLADYRTSPHFSAEQRDALAIADGMTDTPAHIPDDAFHRLRTTYGAAGMVELLGMIAWENYRARMNHALGCEEDGFSHGSVCALPARLAGTDGSHVA